MRAWLTLSLSLKTSPLITLSTRVRMTQLAILLLMHPIPGTNKSERTMHVGWSSTKANIVPLGVLLVNFKINRLSIFVYAKTTKTFQIKWLISQEIKPCRFPSRTIFFLFFSILNDIPFSILPLLFLFFLTKKNPKRFFTRQKS